MDIKYNKIYYIKNRKSILSKHKIWAESNKEHLAGYMRKWRNENRQHYENYIRIYNDTTRTKNLNRIKCAKRKALKFRNGHIPYDIEGAWVRDQGFCGICGETVWRDKLWHLDHIIPLNKGGTDCLENVQITHAECNLWKGNRIF